ncbi:MAG: PspA/IM30 family protein [Candidatus Thiodiazotropha sp.]|jgi:phage shock protein A
MALIARVSQLFRADVNAVLDCIEEPEVLLKQAVREMQEAINLDEHKAKTITLELKQLASRQDELAQRLNELAEELDLCFDTDNEALARVLLKRKLQSERLHKYLIRKQADLQETDKELKKRIDENQARLELMRQKVELLAASESKTAESNSWNEIDFMDQFSINDDDVELAFLREKQRRTPS